jgi:hypothetical protein
MYVRRIGCDGMDWIDLVQVEIISTHKMEVVFSSESVLPTYLPIAVRMP